VIRSLVCLLDASDLEISPGSSAGERLLRAVTLGRAPHHSIKLIVLVNTEHPVGLRLSTVKGPADPDLLVVYVGLVRYGTQNSAFAAMEASISFCGRSAPSTTQHAGSARTQAHALSTSRGISTPAVLSARPFSLSLRQRLQTACHLSQMTSISALLATGLQRDVGTRSYTNPWRMFPWTGCVLGAVRVTSASFICPSRESARR